MKSLLYLIICIVTLISSAAEINLRGGLPNVAAKINAGGEICVAYFGGSITHAKNGWRSKSFDYLSKEYPAAKFKEINATICGTGAEFGAMRFHDDVLSRGVPDLLFIEFRVNGGDLASAEGIVRQALTANPQMDICFVYTISRHMLPIIRKGENTKFGMEMERVAEYYNLPSVDFGPEVVARVDAGSLAFGPQDVTAERTLFSRDNTHPTPEGHDIYMISFSRFFKSAITTGTAGARPLKTPLVSPTFDQVQMVPACDYLPYTNGDWQKVDGRNDKIYCDGSFERTNNMLRGAYTTTKEGTTFEVHWTGKDIWFSDIPQDKEMIVEVALDGAAPVAFKRNRTKEPYLYSRFWRVPVVNWGEHTARVTMKQIPAGQKFYFGQMLVWGKR